MAGKESNSSEIQSPSLIRYAVTFLFGSGGSGAAFALVGQKGFEFYGLITLGTCLVAAIILVIIHVILESGNIKKSRAKGLSSLNWLYVDSFQTIGEFLVRGKPDNSKILGALAADLRNRAGIQKEVERDLLITFQGGAEDIAQHWVGLATRKEVEDVDPD